MTKLGPFWRFKTSPETIRLAVLMYVCFPLSVRIAEDPFWERGIETGHEAVRFCRHRYGPIFAAETRKRRVDGMQFGRWRWYPDEVFVKINGERHYLWRAGGHAGEILESFVTKTEEKTVALKFIKKTMLGFGRPRAIITDFLQSQCTTMKETAAADLQETGRRLTNWAENSRLPFRLLERAMLNFRRKRSLQVFASVFNHFNSEDPPSRFLRSYPPG